jgi:hypothetical protein
MTHCDISLLVAAYETLTVLGEARTYRLGDVFTMAAGCIHHDKSGLTWSHTEWFEQTRLRNRSHPPGRRGECFDSNSAR